MVAPLGARERLTLIAKALRHCSEIVDRETLRVQFRRESKDDLTAEDIAVVLRQVARAAEREPVEESGVPPRVRRRGRRR